MTAIEEQRGGALDVTITAGNSPYSAQLDNGPGRARLYVVRPTGSGRVFRLPESARSTLGCMPSVTVVNLGPNFIDVQTSTGVALAGVGVQQSAEFYLLPDGSWRQLGTLLFPNAISGNLDALRTPLTLDYTGNRDTPTNFRRDAQRQYGYTSRQGPVALTVRVGRDVVLGGGTSQQASVDTGPWPAGSTCLIEMANRSMFAGRGGNGGNGMLVNGTGMTAGSAGGHGLDVYVPTVIIGASAPNAPIIAGGGGGGGGGARRQINGVDFFGGAGGGGAGAPGGAGGPPIGGDQSSAGQPGSLTFGGLGGVPNATAATGGNGGARGAVGSTGQGSNIAGVGNGAAGGAAGNSTRRLSSVSLTIVGTVTLFGSQVTL